MCLLLLPCNELENLQTSLGNDLREQKNTAPHLKLASATVKYLQGIADQDKQTGERRLHMYGGLTDVSPSHLCFDV